MGLRRGIYLDFPTWYDTDAATAGMEAAMKKAEEAPVQPQTAPDPIQQAIDAWVQRETLSVMTATKALHGTLAEYESRVMEDARLRARGTVLAALGVGEAPKPMEALGTARDALLDALDRLWNLVDPPQAVPQAKAEPEAPPWNDPEVLEDARQVLQAISSTDFDSEHPTRLAYLLQANVAHCRRLMDLIPPEHTTHYALVQALRRLGAIRGSANVDAFIKGLARHHRDDWDRIAREALAALARYDTDAEQSPSSKPSEKKPKSNGKSVERDSTPEQVMSLPKLTAAQAAGKSVVLFGGIKVEEKLRGLKDRTGLAAEWWESEEGSPRGSNNGISRVRKDKVSCVVILEGLMSHAVWRALADACEAEGVPYLMGGRGGIGSLIQSLEAAEARI